MSFQLLYEFPLLGLQFIIEIIANCHVLWKVFYDWVKLGRESIIPSEDMQSHWTELQFVN